MEQANEVQEVLGRSYGVPDVDEAELEAGACKGDESPLRSWIKWKMQFIDFEKIAIWLQFV